MRLLEILHTSWEYSGDLYFNGKPVEDPIGIYNVTNTRVFNGYLWQVYTFKRDGVLQVKGTKPRLYHTNRQPPAMALFIKQKSLTLEQSEMLLSAFYVFEFDSEFEALQYLQKYNETNK